MTKAKTIHTDVDESLYAGIIASQKANPDIQKLVPVKIIGPVAQINLKVPVEFQEKLDRYRADHATELRERGCKRSVTAFCMYVLDAYMAQNP
jgi:hypothetical protein